MKSLLITFIVLFISNLTLANVAVLNGLTHKHTASYGQIVEGEIILLNTSKNSQRVLFSLSDAFLSCDNETYFSNENTHPRSSKEWFKSEVAEKELAPNEKYVFKYSIEIPMDTSLNGSYWNLVMIEVEKPIKQQILQKKVGINSKIRYAVQLLTDINQDTDMAIDFTDISLNESNAKTLQIKLKNNSEFIETTNIFLEVYNDKGEKIEVINSQLTNVFPGFCKTVLLNLSSLKSGDYKCIVLAKSNQQYIGANLNLNVN